MKRVESSIRIVWDIHDSWTETLAGTLYILKQFKDDKNIGDNAHLCRLVLISSNHLIEKLFFDLAEEAINSNNDTHNNIRKELNRSYLFEAMHSWPQVLTKSRSAYNFNIEPLKSADELRKQRNRSIHRQSEFVSLEMAKKSLYTAIDTCLYIWNSFHPDKEFKYQGFLKKYPVESVGHYSTAENVNLRT
ncbi:MAG: hypothetical protein AB2551_14640 [Candidatus Thiodiazotropha sp.]